MLKSTEAAIWIISKTELFLDFVCCVLSCNKANKVFKMFMYCLFIVIKKKYYIYGVTSLERIELKNSSDSPTAKLNSAEKDPGGEGWIEWLVTPLFRVI